jgi:hypothetical protein
MTQNSFITIQDCLLSQIKKAIKQWIDKYEDSLYKDFQITLYQYYTDKYILIPDQKIDNQLFNFLVNYLYYPDNITYKPKISGYTIAKDTTIFPKEKLNYEIEIFIPPNDNEFDNVFAVTQYNDVYKIDFGGKTTRVDIKKEFLKPNIDFKSLINLQIFRVKPKDPIEEARLLRSKLIKRIKIISLIIPILFILCYLTVGKSSTFIFFNSAICFGICYWVIVDYKMLQWLRTYMISLVIAIFALIYSFILAGYFPIESGFLKAASIIPSFVLVVQLPLRLGFKKIFKREPVVDKAAPSTADFFYSIILIISAFLVFIIKLK